MVLQRVFLTNDRQIDSKKEFVLYWVQTGLRIKDNYSLKFAIETANKLNKPLLVVFVLKVFPNGNLRQYLFLKQGLLEFKENLKMLGISFVVKKVENFKEVIRLFNRACLVVTDFGYLRRQRFWRQYFSSKIETTFVEVENNSVFNVKIIFPKKAEFAFQLRKKIFERLAFLEKDFSLPEVRIKERLFFQACDEVKKIFDGLQFKEDVTPAFFIGGEAEAGRRLNLFIEKKLPYYRRYRSDPSKNFQSDLSPYLHFGFISPVTIVRKILKSHSVKDENVFSFLNELLVWRELARNFVYFEPNYDNWQNLPPWAIKTLDRHQSDRRSHDYSLEALEKAKTHDPYWNACQKEMVITGKMHNYMRMYWAKKVIEWTKDWRQAYQWLVYLNDKYELDGRDPNGYAGIAWSFGQFDHPWAERPIFGLVRYMSASGLERKFNIGAYLSKINSLEKAHKESPPERGS